MIRIRHSPQKNDTGSSFFSDLLGKDTFPVFIPGRTRHNGLTETSPHTPSDMPSDTHESDLHRQPTWAAQPQGIDSPTSPSTASTATVPSAATSHSGFDGCTEVCKIYGRSSLINLPPGVPTGPAADRQRRHRPSQLPGHFGIEDNRPPPNAPTGPAAQRRQATRLITSRGPQQLERPARSASWSQSLTWQSKEAQAREAFRRMSAEMRHLGIDKSPAAPKGFDEYLNTRMHNVQRGLALQKRQHQKADEQQRQRKTKGEVDKMHPIRSGNRLHHRLCSDRLSPVFGADLCWNACYTAMDNAPHNERVEWPPLAAFKEAGRRIGPKAPGRSLPLPRQNQTQEQGRMIEGDGANDEAGTMGYHEKAVKLDRLDISQPQSLLEPELVDACDIDFESLPAWTREIIAEIKLEEEEDPITITIQEDTKTCAADRND